jgi:hypothetical protein
MPVESLEKGRNMSYDYSKFILIFELLTLTPHFPYHMIEVVFKFDPIELISDQVTSSQTRSVNRGGAWGVTPPCF